ncbi:N-acetyltransferase [Novosphingobium marinum]|uniref:RimJ/RimL family protein N-acetyltransferase n=1 Tax=Novosphingobium marinum TaxID=1514948 RepID=A0A7Z0BTE3_9SPHN|nr:GNAT family N-acetyltransferase [Novosphingobium marinum]NYH95104.1 RimJ/RimL family protein N-acetyltransferase [Novosphingobium marinum]GGC24292.1 N-acetyltransferase [Novosphingobium marinum]
MRLQTDRLVLRPAGWEDLDAMHAILADERATAYWSTPPHSDLEETKEWLGRMIAIPPGEGEDFIVEREGRLIGKAGLYSFPEVGFIFHPDSWGMGYAAEALIAVLRRAFDVHRLPRVEADVDPRNERSLRLLAQLGFFEVQRMERTWFVGGEWTDSVYLHLLPSFLDRATTRAA